MFNILVRAVRTQVKYSYTLVVNLSIWQLSTLNTGRKIIFKIPHELVKY